jgi:hypothetical protein
LGSGQNIAISNGSIISGDGDAIRLFGLSNSNCSIERLRIGGRDGIVLTGTDETEGTNCIVKNNTVNVARFGILCSGCVVSGNTVTAATNPIFASNSSLVVGKRAIGNVALRADDTTGYAQNVLHGMVASGSPLSLPVSTALLRVLQNVITPSATHRSDEGISNQLALSAATHGRQAVRRGLGSLSAHPCFFYRVEQSPPAAEPETVYPGY